MEGWEAMEVRDVVICVRVRRWTYKVLYKRRALFGISHPGSVLSVLGSTVGTLDLSCKEATQLRYVCTYPFWGLTAPKYDNSLPKAGLESA